MLIDLSDILLAAGALGAALYCLVLSRRLRRFTDLEGGVGGAVAVLSAQVDDLTRTLARAEQAARGSVTTLSESSARAEAAGRRLELLMASLHDLPLEAEETAPRGPIFVRHAPAPSESAWPDATDLRAADLPGDHPQVDESQVADPQANESQANESQADEPWTGEAPPPVAVAPLNRSPRSFLDQFVSLDPAPHQPVAAPHPVAPHPVTPSLRVRVPA